MAFRVGLDTNILLRFARPAHSGHTVIELAMHRLRNSGAEFCFTPQNMGEFWNVSTRPADRNGLGLTPQLTRNLLALIEQSMTLLVDDDRVYEIWRGLLINHGVRGVEVHDAHLAATLEAHAVRNLLTLNVADFKRFPNLAALHPVDIQP